MRGICKKEALALLRKQANTKKDYDIVLAHSRAVEKVALDIGRRVNRAGQKHVDIEFLRVAAILHDIGRFAFPPWVSPVRHGVAGEKILRKEGLTPRYQRICTTHIGSGITKSDVLKNKWHIPAKDYIPRSLEEKIICYADSRVWLTRPIRFETVLRRTKQYGRVAVARMKKLHDDIQELMT